MPNDRPDDAAGPTVPEPGSDLRPSGDPKPGADLGPAAESAGPDPFDDLVLDENFVRGGTFEPPARTRLAIARYGDVETSWRHGGGLHDQAARDRRGKRKPTKPQKSSRAAKPRPAASRGSMSTSTAERLPLIVSIVVVVIAAFLMFR